MPATKTMEDKIVTKLKDLPEDGKKKVLEYIARLKNKKIEKSIRLLRKTAGGWKGLIDVDKLKDNIYANRLLSTRTRVKY